MNKSECILDLKHIQIWFLMNHPIFKDGYYWKEGRLGCGPFSSSYEALISYSDEVKKEREAVKKPLALIPEISTVIAVDFNAKCRIKT